jgi:protein gp37
MAQIRRTNEDRALATRSSIEWTEQTWNPVTGCTKVSPGCKHCYAETMALRLNAMGCPGYERGFDLTIHPNRLAQPLARRRPTVYFVNSMSDLFHEDVPETFLDQVFEVMAGTPRHTYQVLTKRSARLRAYCQARPVPPNVWLGVSVENRRHGVPRIADLRTVQARVRFLSVEPLLEDLGAIDLTGIHWVIVGGESGPKARPMRPEWAERLRRQAQAAGVAFFFKQWGAWGPDGTRRSKKANGRALGGRIYDDRPALSGLG